MNLFLHELVIYTVSSLMFIIYIKPMGLFLSGSIFGRILLSKMHKVYILYYIFVFFMLFSSLLILDVKRLLCSMMT